MRWEARGSCKLGRVYRAVNFTAVPLREKPDTEDTLRDSVCLGLKDGQRAVAGEEVPGGHGVVSSLG